MLAVTSCVALKLPVVIFAWHDDAVAGSCEGPLVITAFSHREETTGVLSQRCGLGIGEGTGRDSRGLRTFTI